jgi:hypothetical protein
MTSAAEFPPTLASVTFTLLPKLPTELRLTIWKLTIPRPRVIKIYKRVPRNDSDNTVHAMSSIPSILHANREARTFALDICTPAFTSRISHSFYFDFSRDILSCLAETLEGLRSVYPKRVPEEIKEWMARHLMVAHKQDPKIYSPIRPTMTCHSCMRNCYKMFMI